MCSVYFVFIVLGNKLIFRMLYLVVCLFEVVSFEKGLCNLDGLIVVFECVIFWVNKIILKFENFIKLS